MQMVTYLAKRTKCGGATAFVVERIAWRGSSWKGGTIVQTWQSLWSEYVRCRGSGGGCVSKGEAGSVQWMTLVYATSD